MQFQECSGSRKNKKFKKCNNTMRIKKQLKEKLVLIRMKKNRGF